MLVKRLIGSLYHPDRKLIRNTLKKIEGAHPHFYQTLSLKKELNRSSNDPTVLLQPSARSCDLGEREQSFTEFINLFI